MATRNKVTERLNMFINQTMIIYMKHDITYKGTFRGYMGRHNLVFDLIQKTVTIRNENVPPVYVTEDMCQTQYLNPADLLHFQVVPLTPNDYRYEPVYPIPVPSSRISYETNYVSRVQVQHVPTMQRMPLPPQRGNTGCNYFVPFAQPLDQPIVYTPGLNGQYVNTTRPRAPKLPVHPSQPIVCNQIRQPPVQSVPRPNYYRNIQTTPMQGSDLIYSPRQPNPHQVTHKRREKKPVKLTGEVLYTEAIRRQEANRHVVGQVHNTRPNQSNVTQIQERKAPSAEILHTHTINQRMKNDVKGVGNFRDEYLQTVSAHPKKEFQFQPVPGVEPHEFPCTSSKSNSNQNTSSRHVPIDADYKNASGSSSYRKGYNVVTDTSVKKKNKTVSAIQHNRESGLAQASSSATPSTSFDSNDITKMTDKEFEIYQMKSLGIDQAPLLSMSREQFAEYVGDIPLLRNIDNSRKPSNVQSETCYDVRPRQTYV